MKKYNDIIMTLVIMKMTIKLTSNNDTTKYMCNDDKNIDTLNGHKNVNAYCAMSVLHKQTWRV